MTIAYMSEQCSKLKITTQNFPETHDQNFSWISTEFVMKPVRSEMTPPSEFLQKSINFGGDRRPFHCSWFFNFGWKRDYIDDRCPFSWNSVPQESSSMSWLNPVKEDHVYWTKPVGIIWSPITRQYRFLYIIYIHMLIICLLHTLIHNVKGAVHILCQPGKGE